MTGGFPAADVSEDWVGDMAKTEGTGEEAAARIAKRSKSNLAFALALLPAERRRDMQTFYAFCRIVDDIADSSELARDEKAAGLARWHAVVSGDAEKPTPLEASVAALGSKYRIEPHLFDDIIAGVTSDLDRRRYDTFAELERYCYQVAGAVGLVSIEIFGHEDRGCREYALQLGNALQVTNILRDVRTDLDLEDRIYLPREDMERFGVTESDLRAGRQDDKFRALMAFEADRADAFYAAAAGALPDIDRRAMAQAEGMRRIYQTILAKMRADGFRVFDQRYRIGNLYKVALLIRGYF